jgi:hypothetical protein
VEVVEFVGTLLVDRVGDVGSIVGVGYLVGNFVGMQVGCFVGFLVGAL